MHGNKLWAWYLLLFHSRRDRLLTATCAVANAGASRLSSKKRVHNVGRFPFGKCTPMLSKQGAIQLLKDPSLGPSHSLGKQGLLPASATAGCTPCLLSLPIMVVILDGFTLNIWKKKNHNLIFLMRKKKGLSSIKITPKRINHMTNIKILLWPKGKHRTMSTKSHTTENTRPECKMDFGRNLMCTSGTCYHPPRGLPERHHF